MPMDGTAALLASVTFVVVMVAVVMVGWMFVFGAKR